MNVRGLLLFGSLVGAALFGGAQSSCSGPDPGFLEFRERGRTDPTASSGGTPTDGGGGEGGGPADPVFGTSTFAPGPVGPPAPAGNRAGPASTQHMNTVVDKDCFLAGCHDGTVGPTWGFGGSVHVAATGGAPVAGAEVRVTGPNGTVYASTYTDADGNFWIAQPAGGPIPANSRVGVRNATSKQIMTGTVSGPGATGGGCNSGGTCHGGAMTKLFL
jgi:hypothetical protein